MNNFPNKLKELRISSNSQQKVIADELGIKVRAFQRYEHGDREPNIDTLIALADYFNVSLDELVGRKVEK